MKQSKNQFITSFEFNYKSFILLKMPPKKPDPEAAKKQYDAFKQSDEYKKIQQIYTELKSLPYISQTSKDQNFDGKFQILWDMFYELSVIMKVKPPFKKIQHQWIRSIYFGEKKKVNDKDVKLVLDGIECEFDPIDADSQHNLRQALIKKIYNSIAEKDNWELENYSKARAELKKGFTEFFNLMKSHLKKSFKVVYEERLLILLEPFSNLLDINMKLVLHELKYTTPEQKFVNDFKYIAIKERYCTALQRVLDILNTFGERPVKFMITPMNIFKKLEYTNLSKIQNFYLTPYRNGFDTMKQGLCALFTTGVNFWKVPTEKNEKFVKDLISLINWELIVERFFGSKLLRDQINFLADVLSAIAKANELAEKYMIKRDPNAMEIAIPRLVAFKTIQHMRKYKDKEQELLNRQQEYEKVLGQPFNQTIQSVNSDKVSQAGNSPTKTDFNKTTLSNAKKVPEVKDLKIKKLIDQDPIQSEMQKLGRYWIWENYCDPSFKESTIQQAVEEMKNINPAVYQDIEDAIIRDGMLPRRDRQNEELKNAAETLKHMKTIHNSLKGENMRRPPELWNFPKVVEEDHKFRSIADPKKCYIDGRIESLDNLIIKIGNHLRKFNEKEWNELVRRVIDFYSGEPDPSPFSKVIDEEKPHETQEAE